jgi:hypothetical protein
MIWPMNTALLDTANGQEQPKAKRGRPAKHADAAARQRAWREANTVKTLRLDGKVGPTVEKLAELFDTDQTHVVNNLLRFALANRNWSTMGIGGWDIADKRATSGKRAAPVRDDSLDNFSFV